jgi:hypothetical protein
MHTVEIETALAFFAHWNERSNEVTTSKQAHVQELFLVHANTVQHAHFLDPGERSVLQKSIIIIMVKK